MKRITVSVPDEMMKYMEDDSKKSFRTIAQEVLFLISIGIVQETGQTAEIPERPAVKVDNTMIPGKKWIPNKDWSFLRNYEGATGQESNVVSKSVEPTSNYEEVIKAIESTLDRDVDYEERQELNRMVKEAGLVFNAYKKTLEKLEPNGRYKIIHEFNGR